MSNQNEVIRNAIKKSGGKITRWILRLGKEDGKFESWYEPDATQDFDAFLACLNLKRSHEAVEKRMSDQKKIKTFQKKEEKKRIKDKKLEMAIPEAK